MDRSPIISSALFSVVLAGLTVGFLLLGVAPWLCCLAAFTCGFWTSVMTLFWMMRNNRRFAAVLREYLDLCD